MKLGLLGQSLSHSLSPIIHQSFFEELGMQGSYEKIEVPCAEDLPVRLAELIEQDFVGLNVTIPYKLDVLPLLGDLDDSARMAGAANTLRMGETVATSRGYNTDGSGLAEALSLLDLDMGGADAVLVLGSGGAARAAVIAASALGFKRLKMCGRDISKVQTVLTELESASSRASLKNNCTEAEIATFDDIQFTAASACSAQLTEFAAEFLSGTKLVINATPIGQKDATIPDTVADIMAAIANTSDAPVFVDLVYGKEATPLCKLAKSLNFARVEDGKEMLINQARLAFKIWTGALPSGALARERLFAG
jgi:shikimate dehydrogenase